MSMAVLFLLNRLVLNSESLNRVLEGRGISQQEALQVCQDARDNPGELYTTASNLRRIFKKNHITFSKKAFFNIVNLCRDACSYCTYKAEPGEEKLSMMSRQDISSMLKLGRKYRCVEALFVTGERPEAGYAKAREWLKQNGFASTVEYIVHASEMALEHGMFPHTNAGNLERAEIRQLQKTNVSIGVMLENTSQRLAEKNMPHYRAPSKRPAARLQVLEDAGSVGIPITTGLLVGIGETPAEAVDSIFAIKKTQKRYGNIQEVIIQNFQPKQDTKMGRFHPADTDYFRRIVALTRVIMPEMNIQVPPNLSPDSYQDFLSVGINDWGGISPLTPDYVNPEFAWPAIKEIEENSRRGGFKLKCRFPVYPEFFSFINKKLRDKIAVIEEQGMVRESYWR